MKVFISYRRKDSQYIADRIYDWLVPEFGPDNVFKDVDAIPLGRDFRRILQDAVARCDVLLVVIGPRWLGETDAAGRRRVDDPGDWVRIEIETALERDIPVIPLLVDGASFPHREDLPPSLQELVYRHGTPLRPDPDFRPDMGRVIRALRKTEPGVSGTAPTEAAPKPDSNAVETVPGGSGTAPTEAAPEPDSNAVETVPELSGTAPTEAAPEPDSNAVETVPELSGTAPTEAAPEPDSNAVETVPELSGTAPTEVASDDERKPQSWWTTLPGILTTAAGIITALTGLIVALNQVGVFQRAPQPAPTMKAPQSTQPSPELSTFTYASHKPNDLKKEHWKEKYGWQEIHPLDEPMLPSRFLESSCVKCHHQITDIPQAKKLQAGYQRIVQYGCTGCHTIGGEGSFGPDLTDERTVDPNLSHVASKVTKDWVLKWIKNPHAFRPDSRMPRFYGLTNNDSKDDLPKSHAEIHAIAHYLFARSTPPEDFVAPPAQTDAKRGKELFLQKGCLACHQHRPYEASSVQVADRKSINPDYKPDPATTYDPKNFPEAVRTYAQADYGPNLGNIAAKFRSQPDKGQKWLSNWIQNPEKYHPKSLMPKLQLTFQDAADIASWLISVPGDWPVQVEVPPIEDKSVATALDDLVKLYVTKGGYKDRDGKTLSVSLSEVDQFVGQLGTDEKLYFLGEKTISRLGCFGCHSIPGFENAKPIGTPLNDWGIKSPTRLDYGHIREYLEDRPPQASGDRDGTDRFYQEQIEHETRIGFLYQKLHRPRSYDYLKDKEKYKTWDDRLRMPQFAWANDPAAVEEVMTFVLGLTGEEVGYRYLAKANYNEVQTALAKGGKVLNRYNCTGCHVLEMPKFSLSEGTKVADAFTDFRSNVRSSYTARNNDFLTELYPALTYDPKKKLDADNIESELALQQDDGKPVTIEGMPLGLFENELTVQLWKPVTIRGYTFNVGDYVTLDQTKVQKTPAVGGDFAWLYSTTAQERTGTSFEGFWNRLPPPLVREGNKVQTPWFALFLRDPYVIRPAAQLRMPRFHYGKAIGTPTRETEDLADYFAARDGAEFPYQTIPQQQVGYIAERNTIHPDYLGAGWSMMANKGSPCIQCHAIGQYKPTGGQQVVNGPDLRQVATRFRPGFLEMWIANPRRLVPYTAMPQNVVPHGEPQLLVPRTFENQPIEMVRAIRDTLLNYTNVVEQLGSGSGPR